MSPEERESNNKNGTKIALAVIIIGLLVIIVVLLFCRKPEQVVVTQGGNNIGLDSSQSGESDANGDQDFIYFSGFSNTSLQAGGTITLPCNESNADGDIYMTYTVLEGEEVVYETGLIEPGNYVLFPAAEVLGAGEHEITFHEQPYQRTDANAELSTENMTELYFVDQAITVTVAE